MKRSIYNQLLAWKSDPNRKPLLMQGARQVGKTYLLREFAQCEYENYVYLDFEQEPELIALFDSSLEPKRLIELFGAFSRQKINPGKTLIIFDEIQVCPKAITSLKYFCDHASEYPIAAAGSLLGVSVGKTSGIPCW